MHTIQRLERDRKEKFELLVVYFCQLFASGGHLQLQMLVPPQAKAVFAYLGITVDKNTGERPVSCVCVSRDQIWVTATMARNIA